MEKQNTVPVCSIIIPTRNRVRRLFETLDAYRGVPGIEKAEVIVADDGSSDDTVERLREAAPRYAFGIHILTPQPRGPAAARNAAIRASSAPILIFTGDDIVPAENWLRAHLEAHRRWPQDTVAILGKICASAGSSSHSPFMKFLYQKSSAQFDYVSLDRGARPDFRHFYTSNISIKKSMLMREPAMFDEEFRHAAWEDIELAYRLQKRGLRIEYCPDVVAAHDHDHDLSTFARRQYLSGQMAFIFSRKHPDAAPAVFSAEVPFYRYLCRQLGGVWMAAARGFEVFRLNVPAAVCYRLTLDAAFAKGFSHAARTP